jgi:hypothetical protein
MSRLDPRSRTTAVNILEYPSQTVLRFTIETGGYVGSYGT